MARTRNRTLDDLRALFERRGPLEPWLDCGSRSALSEVRSGKAQHDAVIAALARAASVDLTHVLALYHGAVLRRISAAEAADRGRP